MFSCKNEQNNNLEEINSLKNDIERLKSENNKIKKFFKKVDINNTTTEIHNNEIETEKIITSVRLN